MHTEEFRMKCHDVSSVISSDLAKKTPHFFQTSCMIKHFQNKMPVKEKTDK